MFGICSTTKRNNFIVINNLCLSARQTPFDGKENLRMRIQFLLTDSITEVIFEGRNQLLLTSFQKSLNSKQMLIARAYLINERMNRSHIAIFFCRLLYQVVAGLPCGFCGYNHKLERYSGYNCDEIKTRDHTRD